MRALALLTMVYGMGAEDGFCCYWPAAKDLGSCAGCTQKAFDTDGQKDCESDKDNTWCPSKGPSPAPTPTPTPTPSPTPVPSAEIVGYWDTTWSPVGAPDGANLGVAFSGWNDPQNALGESTAVRGNLLGDKWIDAGGGGYNGRWNTTWVQKWESLIKSGGLSDWAGIVLDVEECFETGLAKGFGNVLRAAKAAGLGTMVTVSASAPYMCDDSEELMRSFFASDDVDFISPQTYGESGPPSFVETYNSNITWADWVGAKARFVPSLTKPQIANGDYERTKEYFKKLGIETTGYVMWPTATLTRGAVVV